MVLSMFIHDNTNKIWYDHSPTRMSQFDGDYLSDGW